MEFTAEYSNLFQSNELVSFGACQKLLRIRIFLLPCFKSQGKERQVKENLAKLRWPCHCAHDEGSNNNYSLKLQ